MELQDFKEKVSKTNKKYNKYNLSNKYGIGYTSKNEIFYFNLEDYDKIKDYCWHKSNNGYLMSTCNNKKVYLHRLIMNCSSNMCVDHINHNTLDNRRENLRICTKQQNNINKHIRSNNTSGVTGVYLSKKLNKWYAQIKINNKSICLGYYNRINDAIKARLKAEVKYFGEYAPQKHLFEEYNIQIK